MSGHIFYIFTFGINPKVKKMTVLIVVVVILMILRWIVFLSINTDYTWTRNNLPQRKKILLWNSFWDEVGWEVGLGSNPFERLGCAEVNCFITDDKLQLNSSDAVLFHIHQLETHPPPKVNLNQRWVFFMLESPGWSNNDNYKHWKDRFNWTMTYRLDSDVPILNGEINYTPHHHSPSIENIKNTVGEKKRPIAWIVSNCPTQSNRMAYVKELQKYIPVDIYGRCGNLTCQKQWLNSDKECMQMIESNYKFYLSFENSFCKDYVTEKFFKALQYDLVPIVRGGAEYDRYVPSTGKWFIDTGDFSSPKQLAQQLLFLDATPSEYMKYLQAKEDYTIRTYFSIRDNPAWCDLCKKLHDQKSPKLYSNIENWWNKRDCWLKREDW